MQSCVSPSQILYRYLEVGFGRLPFPRMGTITCLHLSWNLLLHATAQGDHLDQRLPAAAPVGVQLVWTLAAAAHRALVCVAVDHLLGGGTLPYDMVCARTMV